MHNNPYDWDALREKRRGQLTPEQQARFDECSQFPRLTELGVEQFRKALAGYDSGEVRPNVNWEDVQIPGPAGPVSVRIYKPKGIKGSASIFIHFHAGGFVACGGLDVNNSFNTITADDVGCIVVHPDFRLPPEHKFPAAVEDCWATFQWVVEHADEFGGDANRIAIGGGCTGATLSAVVALMARDAGMNNIKLQILTDAFLDARCDTQSQEENGKGYTLTHEANLWIVERYLEFPQQRWDWRVSPVLVDSVKGVAPALIMGGEWDVLRDEMKFYANRLRDSDVSVEAHFFPNDGHGVGAISKEAGQQFEAFRIEALKKALA